MLCLCYYTASNGQKTNVKDVILKGYNGDHPFWKGTKVKYDAWLIGYNALLGSLEYDTPC